MTALRNDLIRKLRQSAGLTQEALAEAVGLSPRAICKLETGRTQNPSAATLAAVARALGVEGCGCG
jgi:transcriptional regulator with XRE-family HTH domain